MRKILVCILTIVFTCFGGTVYAGVIEDIQAAYPDVRIDVTEKRSDDGVVMNEKVMTIYHSGDPINFYINLIQTDKDKSVYVDVKRIGRERIGFKLLKIEDGNTYIEKKPTVTKFYNFGHNDYIEVAKFNLTKEELDFMKNAETICVCCSKDIHYPIDYNPRIKNKMKYNEAIDYAIKFLTEKS